MDEATSSKPDGADVCLMLLGKTGHGKSATGNCIIGRKDFETSASCVSVTKYSKMESTNINGLIVKVVDTPGLADTCKDPEESAEAAMEAFNSGIALCTEGFDALVLVYRFGQRMTIEERYAVEELKEMLGTNVLREYGILLFTYGDNFDEEDVKMDFKEWCLSVEGHMKDIIKECNNRCVLFDNKTKDKTERSRQRDELLRCVDGLESKGKRYTSWVFEEARATWITLTKEKKYAKVIDKVNTVLGDISNDLVAAQERGGEINDEFFSELREKLHVLSGLIADMDEPEKKKVEDQIKEMDERILFIQNKAEDDKTRQEQLKELCAQNEVLKRQHQEQVEQYQKDYEKMQKECSDKITAIMKESDRKVRAIYEQASKKRRRRRCVIA